MLSHLLKKINPSFFTRTKTKWPPSLVLKFARAAERRKYTREQSHHNFIFIEVVIVCMCFFTVMSTVHTRNIS